MFPWLIPIAITLVGLGADYLIRKDEITKKPDAPEVGGTDDSVIIKKPDRKLGFGEWVEKMPQTTKVLGVMTVAGAVAMMRKSK